MHRPAPTDAASAYQQLFQLLMRTSRIGMAALVFLCLVEAVAYSPWFADQAPFGIDLQFAGPTLWIASAAWFGEGVWCLVTMIRGKGAGATAVACQCAGFAVGFLVVWIASIVTDGGSRDYLGAALYGVLAVLLFTGRDLSRGLLVLTASLVPVGDKQ